MDGYTRVWSGGANAFSDFSIGTSAQADPIYDRRWAMAGTVAPRTVRAGSPGVEFVRVQVGCAYAASHPTACDPGPDGGPASFTIHRGIFTLEDRDAPTVTAISGDAVTNTTWAGPTGISVGAGDQGGGVYRLAVEVDGQIGTYVNLADAPCRAWPGTERTFMSPKPCPSTVGGLHHINPTTLPEGVHTVRVLVEDAAGNQTTAYGPTTKRIRHTDPGPNNGVPSVDQARLYVNWEGRESDRRTIKFNKRPVLKGRLTTATGQPIRDAIIRTTIKRSARNSPSFERSPLKTDEEGRFRWRMPKRISSRTLTFAYHQRVRDDEPIAVRKMRLTVKAGIKLKLSRKTARRGQKVRLTGTVAGRPMPSGGKVVELQARDPGKKWITFRTVRSKKNGKFATTYRFRNAGPARFQMRARARKAGDYPYATGVSPTRTIRVR
ncbi:MAG: hypothetical protein AB7G37_02345 [Solirubrobacteraceae bacterium]